MTITTADLKDIRGAGVVVNEVLGWSTRHRAGSYGPAGILLHHTAGTKSLGVVTSGRPDLPGPLCHFHFPKDGSVNVVAAGRANHAGLGWASMLARIQSDQAPTGNAAGPDSVDGNRWFYGFEIENLGNGKDPWPEKQLITVALVAAVLSRRRSWTSNRTGGHREWTKRKPDPTFDLNNMRNMVKYLLGNTGPMPLPKTPTSSNPINVHYWTNEDGEAMATQLIEVPLDNEGRASHPTGIAMEKFVSMNIEAGVRPNADHFYPGDAGHEKHKPECWPIDDGGLNIVVTGAVPGFPARVWLTTRP